jgi:hypothetical protein
MRTAAKTDNQRVTSRETSTQSVSSRNGTERFGNACLARRLRAFRVFSFSRPTGSTAIGRAEMPEPRLQTKYLPPSSREFLIANPRLEISVTYRKISLLEIPNREEIAFFFDDPN